MHSTNYSLLVLFIPALGPIGTAIEALGTKIGSTKLTAFGTFLEAAQVDIPKILKVFGIG